MSKALVDTSPELCQKGDFFSLKNDGRHFCLFSGIYMLTLVSLNKMQNISTLMRKRLKSEGRAF